MLEVNKEIKQKGRGESGKEGKERRKEFFKNLNREMTMEGMTPKLKNVQTEMKALNK